MVGATRGQPDRPWRRRPRGRVPFEDERDRRRHHPDAPAPASRKRPPNYRALVVGNDAPNFSAGANLMLLLLEAQEDNWDDVDLMVRAFQGATMALKYADVPVVVAPAGLALGGGCEIVAARRSRPGGGRELHRAGRSRRRADPGRRRHEGDAGAGDSGGLGRARDLLPLDAARLRDHRLRQGLDERRGRAPARLPARRRRNHDEPRAPDGRRQGAWRWRARRTTSGRSRAPRSRSAARASQAALKLGVHLAWRAGRISDHDALIGRALAGSWPAATVRGAGTASEQQLLDLEREAFLSLCGRAQDAGAHRAHAEDGQDAQKLIRRPGAGTRRRSRIQMPVVNDLEGAGRPARGPARRTPTPRGPCAPPWSSRIRTRSSAGRCTPRRCSRAPRGWRGSAARCCASTSAASAPARARSIGARGRRKTSAPRSTTWRRAIRARRSGPPASRSDPGSRSRSAPSILASRR